MPYTTQQLLQIPPNAGQRTGVYAPVLNAAMSKYQIVTITRRINGGTNCLADRQALSARALEVLA